MYYKLFFVLQLFLTSIMTNVQSATFEHPPEKFIEYYKSKVFASARCIPEFPSWVLGNFEKQKNNFLKIEKDLNEKCKESKVVYIYGNFTKVKSCGVATFCDSSECVSYPSQAHKFVYTVKNDCIEKQYALGRSLRPFSWKLPHFQVLTIPSNYSHPFLQGKLMWSEKVQNQNLFNSFALLMDWYCGRSGRVEYYYEGVGTLPDECTELIICGLENCTIYPKLSAVYAYTYRQEEAKFTRLLSRPCTSINLSKKTKRAVLKKTLTEENSNEETETSTLNFNLPGYRYCGPGTNIEKMDDEGGPLNDLDNLCREHDVDYLVREDPKAADAKLLEHLMGKNYTSSLYYFPEPQQSLVFTLSETSVYDCPQYDAAGSVKGRILEERWKKQLHEIWNGFCSSALVQPSMLGNGKKDKVTRQPTQEPQPGPSRQIDRPVSTDKAPQETDSTDLVELEDYPLAPDTNGRCRVVINEIMTRTTNPHSYVELRRMCDKTTQLRSPSLSGYHLLLVQIGDPNTIYLSVSLHGHTMSFFQETRGNTRRPKAHMYFVIGSEYTNADLSLSSIEQMVSTADGTRGIPEVAELTFVIVLLHMSETEQIEKANNIFALQKENGGQLIYSPMTDIHRYFIKKYVQDVILYGAPCPAILCEEFTNLIPKKPVVASVNNFFIPLLYVPQNTEVPFNSISRCSETWFPMQIDDFTQTIASPGSPNLCPVDTTVKVFNLQGTPLQSSAQKIIVNVHNFFQIYHAHPTLLTGGPVELTAKSVGLGKRIVSKVLQNCRTNEITTPGTHRNQPLRKQCQIDGFYADMIKRIIERCYEENRPPFAAEIFRIFKTQVLETEESRRIQGELFTPFKCHEQTFRKVLRRLGFKFGKINQRDTVLMRPEFVNWRGSYIKALRDNRASKDPMKVIWLDETWIDPNARSGKAWIPANVNNYRERAKYSYRKHKVARGPRLIVLNAGGEDGFIHGAMDVFPVSKKDSKGDYHENVNAEYYIKWFQKLLVELDKTEKKYIIIMLPTSVPKSSDTKLTMYEWLEDNIPIIDRRALLPIHLYRKFELWKMVQDLKKTTNYYVVDQMAANKGHKVLRLPPYNCDLSPIEYVWKDLKDWLRKNNPDQSIETINRLAIQFMTNYGSDKWKIYIEHIKRLEDQYWKNDGLFDEFYDSHFKLIIPLGDDDDEDDVDDTVEYNALPVRPDIITSVVHDDFLLKNLEDSTDAAREHGIEDDELLDV